MSSSRVLPRILLALLFLSPAATAQFRDIPQELRIPAAPVMTVAPRDTIHLAVEIQGLVADDVPCVEIHGPTGFETRVPFEGGFAITVDLLPNQDNEFLLYARKGQHYSAPTRVDIRHDTHGPELVVETPRYDRRYLLLSHVVFSGTVSDPISGPLGVKEVRVDGQEAILAGHYWFINDVPLAGIGTFKDHVVEAEDLLGNVTTKIVRVHRDPPPPLDQPRLDTPQGNTMQAKPGDVCLQKFLWYTPGVSPEAAKWISISVEAGDGGLSETPSGEESDFLQLQTDANGEVSFYWTMGTEVGAGNQRVKATATDSANEVFIHASLTTDPTDFFDFTIDSGDGQRGDRGALTLDPIVVVPQDAFENAIEGVTLEIIDSDGSIITSRTSDESGRAKFHLPHGNRTGGYAVRVSGGSETYELNLNPRPRRKDGTTRSNFQLEDDSGRAIEGAEVLVSHLSGHTLGPVASDEFGFVSFDTGDLVGPWFAQVDGSTATAIDGVPIDDEVVGDSFWTFPVGQGIGDLSAPGPKVLPLIEVDGVDREVSATYDGTQDLDLFLEDYLGVQFEIFADSITLVDGSRPSPQNPVEVSVSAASTCVEGGSRGSLAVTISPRGAKFDPPAKLIVPNVQGDPIDTTVELIGTALGSSAGALSSNDVLLTGLVIGPNVEMSIPVAVQHARESARRVYSANRIEHLVLAVQDFDPTNYLAAAIYALERGSATESIAVTDPGSLADYQFRSEEAWDAFSRVHQLVNDPPGTQAIAPLADLHGVVRESFVTMNVHRELAAGDGVDDPTITVTSLNSDWSLVRFGLESVVVQYSASVTMDPVNGQITTPDTVLLGDVELISLLPRLEIRPQSYASLKIVSTNGLGQYQVTGYVFLPDEEAYASLKVAGQNVTQLVSHEYRAPRVQSFAGVYVTPIVSYSTWGSLANGRLTFSTNTPLPVPTNGSLDHGTLLPNFDPFQHHYAIHSSPKTIQLEVGDTVPMTATGTTFGGTQQDVSDETLGTKWLLTENSGASVQTGGTLTADETGEGYVIANSGTQIDVSFLNVTSSTATTIVGGKTVDASGNPVVSNVRVAPFGDTFTTDAQGRFGGNMVVGFPSVEKLKAFATAETPQGWLAGVKSTFNVPHNITDFGEIEMTGAAIWISDVDGNWEDGANWSSGSPPLPTDIVVIDRPGSLPVVTLSSTVSVQQLVVAEHFVLAAGGDLTVQDVLTLGAVLELAGGSLGESSLLPLSDDGHLVVTSNSNVSASSVAVDVIVENGSTLTVQQGFTLEGILELDSTGASTRLIALGAQSLDGDGTVKLQGASAFFLPLNGHVDVYLDIEGDGTVGTSTSDYDLFGDVTVDNGDSLLLRGANSEVSGVLSAENGSNLEVDFSNGSLSGGAFANSGSILEIDGSPAELGPITLTDSTLELSADFSIAVIDDLLIEGTSTVLITGNMDNSGNDLDLGAHPVDLELSGGSITGGSLSNGQLNVSGANNQFDDVVINDDATVRVQNAATLSVVNDQTLDGTMIIDSSGNTSTVHFPGNQTLEGAGLICFVGTTGFQTLAATGGGTLIIAPGITVKAPRGRLGSVGTSILNRGLVDSTGPGTLFFEGVDFTNEGGVRTTGSSGGIWSNAVYTQVAGTTNVGAGTELRGQQGIHVQGGDFVPQGSLVGNLSVDGLFDLEPGNTIDLFGGYAQGPGGEFTATLGGLVPGVDHSQLDLTGSAVFDGIFRLELEPGYLPDLGDVFPVVLFAGGSSGAFSDIILPPLGGGLTFEFTFDPSALLLTVVKDQ